MSEKKPWCQCQLQRVSGYRLDRETGSWVHADCGKMSKIAFMKKLQSMSLAEFEGFFHEHSDEAK